MLRQLKHRFRDLDPAVESHIRSLSIDHLENLGEALLDFTDLTELISWLENIDLE